MTLTVTELETLVRENGFALPLDPAKRYLFVLDARIFSLAMRKELAQCLGKLDIQSMVLMAHFEFGKHVPIHAFELNPTPEKEQA